MSFSQKYRLQWNLYFRPPSFKSTSLLKAHTNYVTSIY